MKRGWFSLNAALAVAVFALASCGTVSDKDSEGYDKPKAGYKSSLMKNLKTDTSKEDHFRPIDKEIVKLDDLTGVDGQGDLRLMPDAAVPEAPPVERKEVPFYEEILKNEQGGGEEMRDVEINTDAAELYKFIDMINSYLNCSYIMDPRVKGAVTIHIKTKMTQREIWRLFERILWLSGAYCSYQNGVIQILPFAKMPQERRILTGNDGETNVEVALFHVINGRSQDIVGQIKPFLTEGAQAINIADKNDILVVEAPLNMPKIEALIRMLDKKERLNWPKVALHCQNVSAAEIKEELINLLPVLGFPVTADKAAAEPGSIHLTSVDRMGVLVASAATNEAIDELKRWVNILDRSDIGQQERVYVYKVVNNTADELLKAVSAIFTTEATSVSAPSASPSAGGATSTAASIGKTTTKSSKKSDKGDGQAISVFETPIKLFADGIHNRLVVRTTPRAYAMLKALLKRLDTIPAQVLLQVMIAEINLSEGNQYGLEFSGRVRHTQKPYQTLYGTNYEALTSQKTADGKSVANSQGFNYYLFNPDDPDKFLYLRAMAGENNTKTLSSPQIIAISHTKAQVKIGDRVPIVTAENQAQDTTNIYQQIQYQDTGIILNLTPHITKGGRIAIDIDSTISDAVKTTSSEIDSPTIQERKLTTTLSMRNKSTVIIGGLIWDKSTELRQSVPIIAKMPIVSNVFGYNDIDRKRVELLMLITATIIDESTDLQELIRRYKTAVKAIDELEAKVER